MTIFLILFVPASVMATPEDDFIKAENNFKFQDYKNAAAMLEKLLYPEIRLTEEEQVIKAREYLGACYFWLRNEKRMNEEFTSLLVRNPSYKLDPFYYPAPLIEKFNSLHKRLVELKILPEKPEETEKTNEKNQKIKSPPVMMKETILIEKNYYIFNFTPFGLGQFQNGQPVKGSIFLSLQALSLAANIGSYFGIELLRGADGKFSSKNLGTAKDLRTIQYGSLAVFAAIYLWSVIDALVHYEPQKTYQQTPVKPEPEKGSLLKEPAGSNSGMFFYSFSF